MESQAGLKTKAIAELRKFLALIDEREGVLKRLHQLANEEEDEEKRLKMKAQISDDADFLIQCVKNVRLAIEETLKD